MELQQRLEGHNGCVNTVAFDTEAGNILISGSDDMQIMLWDWERGGRAGQVVEQAPFFCQFLCKSVSRLLRFQPNFPIRHVAILDARVVAVIERLSRSCIWCF
jgi:WD40 repeat protein